MPPVGLILNKILGFLGAAVYKSSRKDLFTCIEKSDLKVCLKFKNMFFKN